MDEKESKIVLSNQQKLAKYNSDIFKKGLTLANQLVSLNTPKIEQLDTIPKKAEELWRIGENKINEQDYQGAIEYLNQALAINPNYYDAYHSRGFAKSHLDDKEGAIADYNQALKINPQAAKTYNNRGGCHQNLGNYLEAIEDCKRALQIDPNLKQAYVRYGLVLYNLGDYQGAIDYYIKAWQIDSSFINFEQLLSLACQQLEERQKQIDTWTRVVQINPNIYWAYIKRGCIHLQIGKYVRAIEDFEQAVKLDPEMVELDSYTILDFLEELSPEISEQVIQELSQKLMSQALLLHESGDYEGAISIYTTIIDFNPNNAEAYYRRSTTRSALGDFVEAIEDIEAAKSFS